MRTQGQLKLIACHCCGKIHRLPPLGERVEAICVRCRATIAGASRTSSRQRTAAAAIAALVLYGPAITLPLLEIEQLGHHHSSNLLLGTWELVRHGSWFVGGVVLLFSIVLPFLKLVFLLELSVLGLTPRRHRAATYRIMEVLGKWSMMDVLLIAFMVMLVKLGTLVEFHLGPAVIAFALCVVMSMVASMSFDPHSIWDDA
jgi:paraquat-inducible protein A